MNRKIIILTALVIGLMTFLMSSPKKTDLRAVGTIDRLPLAPSQSIADNYELEYNVWDVPERVKNADNFPRAPFKATVKILEKGALSSKIAVINESDNLVGWIPNDWLQNSDEPIKRRESMTDQIAKQEADKFLGLTESQLKEKLGTPIKTEQVTDPTDGQKIQIFSFDETPSKETFFVIEQDGGVIDGEYVGVKLTPKYR